MLVKTLSNFDLMERFNKLVRTERKITHLVLECIAEIDSRKLYLQKAYSSLFNYLVEDFGYSPSAAIRVAIDTAEAVLAATRDGTIDPNGPVAHFVRERTELFLNA